MALQRPEKARAAIPEPQPAAEAPLSQRKIKTLHLNHYSPKTWREAAAKVLIPKYRAGEGVPPAPGTLSYTVNIYTLLYAHQGQYKMFHVKHFVRTPGTFKDNTEGQRQRARAPALHNLGGKSAPVGDFFQAFSAGMLEKPDAVAVMFEFVDVGPDFRLP
jgi:hypothetical protein